MKILLEVGEKDIKRYVLTMLEEHYNIRLEETDIKFEVKSNQNFRAEWEVGEMRARVEKEI